MKLPLRNFGDVCTFVRGPFGGSLKKNSFKESGYAIYEQQHAINNQFNSIRYFIDDNKFAEMKRFELKANDLIMSCSGTMGKIAIVPENIQKGIINQALLKLTPSKELDKFYLMYWMKSENFQENIAKYSKGAAIKNVASVKILKQIEIPFPKIHIQKQIIEILDKTFESIEKAKINIEKNIQNTKELFDSRLNEIFSQKGDGWDEKTINDVSQITNGYSFKSQDFSSTNSVKSVKITNVGVSEFVENEDNNLPKEFLEKFSHLKVYENDLVIALTRTIISNGLKIAKVLKSYNEALLNQRVASLSVDETKNNSNFLYYFFSSQIAYNYVLSNVNTLMQPNLSIKDLKAMPINVPKIEVQNIMVNELENLANKTKQLEKQYQQKLNNLEELKKSILEKAFSGELLK